MQETIYHITLKKHLIRDFRIKCRQDFAIRKCDVFMDVFMDVNA